jgi:hypothetical protein
VALMLVEKRQAFHHPRVEPVARVACNLAHDVEPVLEPCELGTRADREDRDLAILTLITELSYWLPTESVTRLRVVW